MPKLTPQEIDAHLSTLQPAEQDAELKLLSEEELSDYAKFSAEIRNTPQDGSQSEVAGRKIYHPPAAEVARPTGDNGNSFMNTGMGLATRGLVKGIMGIPAMALDAATGGEASQAMDSLMTGAGMRGPREGEDGQIDRLVEAGFSGMGGAGAAGVGTGIMANGGRQAVGGAMGTMAGEHVAEKGGSAGEQIAAALLAGSAPGALRMGREATVRGIMRGSDPSHVRDVVSTFERAGTMPTVADATGGDKATAVEGFLSQLFGSGGIVRKRRLDQEQQIGEKLTKTADDLYPAMSNEDMGAYISSNAEEGFKPQGRQILDDKYRMLETQLPSDTRVDATPFRQYIGEKTAVPGAISKTITNPLVGGDQAAWGSLGKDLDADLAKITKDTGQGGLPLSSVKELRTRIGRKIEDAAFSESGGNVADLRGAYGVLSESMKAAAKQAGPKAEQAFADATAAANHYHDILETVKPVIDKAGGFEKVFTSSLAGTKDGGTVVRNVYHLLSPDARNATTSQILRRAAKTGGADPEDFDMLKFARNYSNMDQEAKKVIFPGQYQEDLDKVSKAILTIQKTKEEGGAATTAAQGRVGVQAALQAPLYIIAAATASGHPVAGSLAATAVLAGFLGARSVAHWMTNPKTVHFLAETTELPKEQIPIAINNLAQQARAQNDPEMGELAEYLKSQVGDE